MVTTRRSVNGIMNDSSTASAVDLLERKLPTSYREFTEEQQKEESVEASKERMRKNLNMLLYGKESVAETEQDSQEGQYQTETAETSSRAQSFYDTTNDSVMDEPNIQSEPQTDNDDDIKPTSTTMQFGKVDTEVLDDMAKQKEKQSNNYRLNAKGKLVVALYVVAVALILTLIVLNTGVLAMLSKNNAEKSAQLSVAMKEYNAVVKEIDEVSAESNIIDIAENVYGMVK